MDITELDDTTIRQIAAGEVVERPSSVVKELVENSLDAGATQIDVQIDNGGKDRIRVADNGVGMTREEVQVAVQEHTTSKIGDIADLEAGLETLGFRGEALYAIGAVSTMTVTTKPNGSDHATELIVKNGEIVDVSPAGRPVGTTVEVTQLFAETPARRKFLKADSTEFDRVNQMVTRYALANPDVALSLDHNDREVFATTGQGDLQGALLSVYGREVAESMIELPDHEMVTGYVSHPETTRSTRDYISTYINGRYVQSNTVRRAIVDAYDQQLASDRYPFAVVFLEIDPQEVDVNVHPRKLEVRFENETAVKETVKQAVREALLDHGLLRSTAPRGRSAPDEVDVAPEPPAENTASSPDTNYEKAGERQDDKEGDQSKSDIPTEMDLDVAERWGETSTSDTTGTGAGQSTEANSAGRQTGLSDNVSESPIDKDPSADAADSPPSDVSSTKPQRDDSSGDGQGAPPNQQGGHSSDSPSETAQSADSRPAALDGEPKEHKLSEPAASSRHSLRFSATATQLTLDEDTVAQDMAFERLPKIRVLGQAHGTYIIGETEDGLVLIDQHAADERINYERLQERLADERTTQQLAEPVELELTGREAAIFPTYAEALEDIGFQAEQTDDSTLTIKAVPAVFDQTLDPELLQDVLAELLQDESSTETRVDVQIDSLLADLACYPSLTGNTSLTEGSVRELLDTLDDCENPYSCPHGRPVVIKLSKQELEERFERDYPGHKG